MRLEVSEKKIRQAVDAYNTSAYSTEEPSNAFTAALRLGRQYKDADLTPIYFFDDITNEFIVTSLEHFENKGN